MFGRLGIGVLPVLSHFTGYLRIAADEHNFTDMTSGAVKGDLVWLFRPLLVSESRNSIRLSRLGIASLRPMIATSSNVTLIGSVGSH